MINNSSPHPWGEYERLLEQHHPDLPDEWDMHEDTESVRRAFSEGRSAQEVFEAHHGWWFSQQVRTTPIYKYNGSEFGD